jgi:aspartyl/asparaginyl beta-hydroxylase (cupin superfamily)
MAQTRYLDYHLPKKLLNNFFARYAGGDRRPVFHDIATTAPTLATVTASYPEIRAECERLLASRVALPEYHAIDPGEAPISDTKDPGRWTVYVLEILGHRPAANRARCPATCGALAGVRDLVQAFFSILEAGTSVPLHEGPYLGYLRYHLGLVIPDDVAPVMRVGACTHAWQPGEAVLFDDTWPHAVENHSKQLRAVLVVDVLRPMPPLPALLNRAVVRLIARPTYGRRVAAQVRRFEEALVAGASS